MATEVLADDKALREVRREHAFAQMEADSIDALLLGREANARYISGAQRLWTAGTRPYGPGCVVVRSTRAIHLVSTWDEGIPDDIPHENLFGITWNPGNLFAWLGGIDGLGGSVCIGTDSLTPRFAQILPKVYPSASFVDAEPMLEALRKVKTPEELEALGRSIAVTQGALDAAVAALRPGVSERHLAAVFMEAMAAQGVTTPATQRVATVQRNTASPTRRGTDPVAPQDLVTFDAGVVVGGYIAEIGRTWPADQSAVDASVRALYGDADALWSALLAACRPGSSCSALLKTYEAMGHRLPATPVACGLGLGFDVPVVSALLPKTAAAEQLLPGMVLAVTATVSDEARRTVTRKDVVHIGPDGPEVLSNSPHFHA